MWVIYEYLLSLDYATYVEKIAMLGYLYLYFVFVTCPIILLYVPLNIADVDRETSDEVVRMDRVSHLCRYKRVFNLYFIIAHL